MDPITLVAGLGGLSMMYNFYNYYYSQKEEEKEIMLREEVDEIMEEILGEKPNTIEDIAIEINKKNLLMELKNKQFRDNLNIVEDSDDIIEPDSEEYE